LAEERENSKEESSSGINLLDRWKGMGRSRQVAVIILAAALIAAILLFVQYLSRPQYVTLYSNLDQTQASPVLQFLREQGISYRLDNLGTEIKVPQDKADELRIEMAGKGMPFAQGLGFELFDEESLGMTDFERQVKMQRALQEELRRTITSLDAVIQARVHLALPEPSIFLKESTEPSAAVYLKLNPLAPLEEEQLRGIVCLVASSVENLKPENVVMIDSRGNILYDAVTSADPYLKVADSALTQLGVKRAFEDELEHRLQAMLEKVFGPGKALALVTVDMDFDSRETTVITYDDTGVPRSTHIREESYEGESPGLEEVGEANYPGYVGVTPGGNSSHEIQEETINYEIGESVEKTITAPGKILRINTSVVVDSSDNSIGEERIEQINALVSSAIGFNEERGDRINVEGMDFDSSLSDQLDSIFADEPGQVQNNYLHQAVIAGAVLAALILVLLVYRRKRRLNEESDLFQPEGRSLEELLVMGDQEEEPSQGFSLEGTALGKAKKMINESPEVAVSVLKSWLIED
jgi:flagellar M-ring protein FliF